MTITLNGTSGIVNDATDLSYTGTLTGSTGVVNIGSGQVYKDASGNVGIGTSSPAYKLDAVVNTNTRNGYNVYGGNGGAAEQIGYRAVNANGTGLFVGANGFSYTGGFGLANQAVISTIGAQPLILGINNVESARIDSSGNLLVGKTTASSSKFEVAASAEVASFQNTGGTGTVRFYNSAASTIGYIQWSGSTTSYVTSSDYRLKQDIQPMAGALAKIAALKPVTYKWNVDGSDGQGFIAHELAEVEPACVTGEKDAVDADGNPQYQGIDTSFLVATLTAAIQEQQAIITALTTRITALEAQIV